MGVRDWMKKRREKAATDSIARWRATGSSSYATSRTFTGTVDDETRKFLSLYEPCVYWIVTRVAKDIFDDWFTVVDVSKEEEDTELDDAVQEILKELKAKERITRLFTFERRYGTALLLCRYSYSAESEDTWDTPLSDSSKPELMEIIPYAWPMLKVDKLDTDPNSPTYGYPIKYKIDRGTAGIADFVVDHTRTIRAATRLDEHLFEGVSIVDLIADDAVGYRTFRTGVYKLWVRYGSGAPELHFPEATLEQLQAWDEAGYFDDISNRTYFLSGRQGGSIEFKGVAGVALDPTPTDNIGINNLSMASGIPSDILKGTQAGTLSGSRVDERQYFKRISAEQSAVEPIVRELIDILISTGQVEFTGKYKIEWNSVFEIDDLDAAKIELIQTQIDRLKLGWMTKDELRDEKGLGPYPEEEIPVEPTEGEETIPSEEGEQK